MVWNKLLHETDPFEKLTLKNGLFIEDTTIKLLLHCNGTNGSTTLIDSSPNNRTVTPNGDAQISTAQSKFGGASLLLDGSGDYLTAPDSDDFAFGIGDLTVDCWLYLNALPSSAGSIFDAGTGVNAGRFSLNVYANGKIYVDSNANLLISNSALSTGQWYHIAVTRSGTTMRIFINGNLDKSGTVSTNFTGNKCRVGSTVDGYSLSAYIDELLIMKGKASQTAAFTPPTEEYCTRRIASVKRGATQAAAGAIVNEPWLTLGHATLPNGVFMMGE